MEIVIEWRDGLVEVVSISDSETALGSGARPAAVMARARLDLCEDLDIRSMDDFRDASAEPMAGDARERLRASWRLARSLGHLPEHRQRGDGERLGRRRGPRSDERAPRREGPVQTIAAQGRDHAERWER